MSRPAAAGDPEGDLSELVSVIDACYDDPELFFDAVLGVRLRRWQRRNCQRIRAKLAAGEHRLRVLLRTCHGAGKTVFAAGVLLWWMTTRSNSRGLTTAQTWTQVEELLWPNIAKLYSGSLMAGFGFGRILNTKYDLGDTWYAIGAAADRPEHLEGHHSDTAAVRIVDEAKGVPAAVFTATEGMLTSPESLDLWISTPALPLGDFYERDAGPDETVIRDVVDVDELISDPAIPARERAGYKAWKQEKLEDWGEDSDDYLSRVLARYCRSIAGAMISLDLVRAAVDRAFKRGQGWRLIMAVDVAGAGRDETVVTLRFGPVILWQECWSGADPMETTGRIVDLFREHKPQILIVDEPGMGSWCISRLREVLGPRSPVVAFNPGARANDHERFENLKAEVAYGVMKRFQSADISLPEESEKLQSQLVAWKLGKSSRGRNKLIDPKDSPDRADSLLISFAPDFIPADFAAGTPAWAR